MNSPHKLNVIIYIWGNCKKQPKNLWSDCFQPKIYFLLFSSSLALNCQNCPHFCFTWQKFSLPKFSPSVSQNQNLTPLSLTPLSLSLSLSLTPLSFPTNSSLFRRTPLSFPANSSLPRHSLHFLDLQLVSSTPFHFFHRNRDRSGAERPSKRFVSLSQLFFTNIIMFDMKKKRVFSIFSETQIL